MHSCATKKYTYVPLIIYMYVKLPDEDITRNLIYMVVQF